MEPRARRCGSLTPTVRFGSFITRCILVSKDIRYSRKVPAMHIFISILAKDNISNWNVQLSTKRIYNVVTVSSTETILLHIKIVLKKLFANVK